MSYSKTFARDLTFGERAVGITFNPSHNAEVNSIKANFALIIDRLNEFRTRNEDSEVRRMYSVAITELQTAQMWAIKAITWESD